MSAELTLTALLSKFWAPLAAVAAFILSHVRLETKFNAEKEAVRERMNRIEDGITSGLNEIKSDIKELTKKVDANNEHANELNRHLLERLSK